MKKIQLTQAFEVFLFHSTSIIWNFYQFCPVIFKFYIYKIES